MKVYFLRLTEDDFPEKDGNVWTSDVIDLYDNDVYTNFSVTKSNYGLPDLNTTWIGLERTESLSTWGDFYALTWEELKESTWMGQEFFTDTGKVIGGRYIDQSGRIDLVSWNIEDAPHGTRLVVRNSDINDQEEEWETSASLRPADEISFIDASRYAQFKLEFTDAPDEVVIFARVEIDRPVMAPLYRSIRKLADQFPEWTAIHGDADNLYREVDPEELEVASPGSLGGSFLNAVSGEWLEDLRRELTYRDFQKYVTTVDLKQLVWVYKSSDLPRFVWRVEGDGVELARTGNWDEFLKARDEDACFIDYEDNTIYTIKEYDSFTINGNEVIQEVHHVWNYLDEIGMFVDLPRLHMEDNETYQARILDVYRNRGGVGVESLKRALRRELNLWKHMEDMFPDSDYDGAYPEIIDMQDIENDPRYFEEDGMPTNDFVELVEQISRQFPTTWGRFHWNKAVWDLSGDEHVGYGLVPYRFDAESLDDAYIQSGVGDGDDLFVFHPSTVTGPREFSAKLKVRGRQRVLRTEYPRVEVEFTVRGKGDRTFFDNPVKQAWFSVEIVTTDQDNPTYIASFLVGAQSDVDHGQSEPTIDSYGIFTFFDEGERTSPDISFNHSITNEPYDEEGVIPLENIETVTIKQGRWEAGEYVSVENQDHFEVWFADYPDQVLTYDSTTYPSYGWENDKLSMAPVVMKSLLTEEVPGVWETDGDPFGFTLNGVAPYLEPGDPVEIEIPEILWDPYITDPYIEIQLELTKEREIDPEDPDPDPPEYGAITYNEKGEGVFLSADHILIDGDGTQWTSDGRMILDDDVTSVEFSTGTSSDYPVVFPAWDLFEAEQIDSFDGIVDENGPWRFGEPSPLHNSNFRLKTFHNLTRDDFDIPHDDEYVVTWMGVSNDSESRVTTWLDTHVVVSEAEELDDDEDFPEGAIRERFEDDVFYYEPIVVRARMRGNTGPEWNPQMHSGYLYDRNQEYYFFARRKTEISEGTEIILEEVARQGAPIIVRHSDDMSVYLRQVSFFDEESSPLELTLRAQKTVQGTGSNKLFLPHADVYDVEVVDSSGDPVDADSDTATNVLNTDAPTTENEDYIVTYTLNNSFFADHDYIDEDGNQRTRLVFDAEPEEEESYLIDYEGSEYDPATPVDIPLNPFYTTQTEGFLYISHNEYTLDSVKVRLSPAQVLADGVDYMFVTIISLDENGNPKPNQEFSLSTSFGSLDVTELTTDHDGFAVALIESIEDNEPPDTGTLTITGAVDATIEFDIEAPRLPKPRLFAAVNSEKLQADEESHNFVYGRVEDADREPVAGAVVEWNKARFIYDLFTENIVDSGIATTDSNGTFELGPFMTAPSDEAGYWFISIETTVDDHDIGDVVFWHEYPVVLLGVENMNGLPQHPVQMNEEAKPDYSDEVKEPVSYDEEAEDPDVSEPEINWLPPSWFPIAAYKQYQLGILGTGRDVYTQI